MIPMETEVEYIIKDIKDLHIQGARNIAKAVVKALIIQAKASKARKFDEFYSELLEVGDALASSRPTEPMLRNSITEIIRFTLMQIRTNKAKNVEELKAKLLKKEEDYIRAMDSNSKELWEMGARMLPKSATVFTHCHSSSVTGIIKRAVEIGKNIHVIVTETRPLYQGRKTAKELAEAGIEVTYIVDSAMNAFMKKVDLCLVGADAVTSMGDLINKIGTSTLAHVARAHDISFYSAAELYKYDPVTLFGNREVIEERDPKEVWEERIKGVTVRNPAFDATAAKYINGYITEVGVVSPQSLAAIASEKLGIKL